MRHRLEELQQQLRDLETEVAAAEHASLAAEQQRDQADKAHADARLMLEHAEQQLEDSAHDA